MHQISINSWKKIIIFKYTWSKTIDILFVVVFLQDDDQPAYQSESDVDEIYLMPESGKNLDYEYEHYGYENPLVARLAANDHDLSVIDEIPYLDEVQSQFTYVSEQTCECDEVLTIYKICSSDDLLTVREEPAEEEESAQHLSSSEPTVSSGSYKKVSNIQVKCVGSDVSISADSRELKTVIERADSMELLSGSSSTIRSSSTLTGCEFETVKNLHLDSCSTSKMSLSLKSDCFDEFTITPDEPRVVRNCDAEDFTLTPEASNEGNAPVSACDEAESDLHLAETMQSDQFGEMPQSDAVAETKADDESISSNEVLMIVDKFLAGERLLQQNLSIIPIDPKFTSPLISPIDSDASSTNALIEKQKSILFNLQSSSSKSTLDDAVDLDKLNFDENFDMDETNDRELSTFTSELTKEFDMMLHQDLTTTDVNNGLHAARTKLRLELSRDGGSATPLTLLSPKPTRMPTRYSMQRLEPYYFADDVTAGNTVKEAEVAPPTNVDTEQKPDYSNACDTNERSFLQKKILSKLKKNKSQSLGNLNKKSRCFPL